jgi:hypothetical protein
MSNTSGKKYGHYKLFANIRVNECVTHTMQWTDFMLASFLCVYLWSASALLRVRTTAVVHFRMQDRGVELGELTIGTEGNYIVAKNLTKPKMRVRRLIIQGLEGLASPHNLQTEVVQLLPSSSNI